jgi:hypothetical protein
MLTHGLGGGSYKRLPWALRPGTFPAAAKNRHFGPNGCRELGIMRQNRILFTQIRGGCRGAPDSKLQGLTSECETRRGAEGTPTKMAHSNS